MGLQQAKEGIEVDYSTASLQLTRGCTPEYNEIGGFDAAVFALPAVISRIKQHEPRKVGFLACYWQPIILAVSSLADLANRGLSDFGKISRTNYTTLAVR